ncbi:MAG: FtsX-like permease family protein [Candidatus Krumholzibacteria bacterium]|nr:FtsX-like permease family protein [Candidatus Krumholzibacteria bacterium]
MLVPKLAWRNIVGAGLRTWLNVIVLSLAFVMIIWAQGFVRGMFEYTRHTMIQYEIAGGQFWHPGYDPYDPLTIDEAHGIVPAALQSLAGEGEATAVLVAPGAIYPDGRAQNVLLKGIDPAQTVVEIPTGTLAGGGDGYIPALIGERMARQTGLGEGDWVVVRWRDAGGTFDAADMRIEAVMSTTLASIDQSQVWLPLEQLRGMLRTPGEATFVILGRETPPPAAGGGWIHRDLDYLLSDITAMIRSKYVGMAFFYGLLLFMALIAIFDTQVLAVWRRRKEMGTLMALGMVRSRIIALFTLEGALHGLLAFLAGAIYGIPLLWWTARAGFPLPEIAGEMGFALPERLYPSYGALLVLGTAVLVMIAVTVVSYLPAAKISRLRPTDALRGKMT